MGSPDLCVLSLGAGVQSSALYLMACRGDLPDRPDVAIFADTQQEPPWVYENLWRLAEYGSATIPIVVATAGDLGDAVIRKCGGLPGRFASVPFWVRGAEGRPTPGRRHCTRDYKVDTVRREIRRLLGVGYREHATRYRVEEWIGISTDEASRAKPSRYPWITTRWPLLYDRPTSRRQALTYLAGIGWPEIKKSSCIFCPWRNNNEWVRWRDEHPDLFAKACWWDEQIRDASRAGLRNQQYILRTLTPLRDVQPDPPDRQIDLFENECEGMCGV